MPSPGEVAVGTSANAAAASILSGIASLAWIVSLQLLANGLWYFLAISLAGIVAGLAALTQKKWRLLGLVGLLLSVVNPIAFVVFLSKASLVSH